MVKTRRILLRGLDGAEKLETVSRFARLLVEKGKRDPKIRDLAVKITRQCQGKDYLCEAKTLHAYVRDNIRYIKDTMAVERFATANRTLFTEKAGDCDDSAIALSALLESIGHETRLILIDGDLLGKFTHIIAQVNLGDTWHWMETTKKVPFNWKPPFTITHIIDKISVGEKDMENLDDIFGIENLGLKRKVIGRGFKPAPSPLTKNIFKSGASRLKSAIVKKRDSIVNKFQKGIIRQPKAKQQMRVLRDRAKSVIQKLSPKSPQAQPDAMSRTIIVDGISMTPAIAGQRYYISDTSGLSPQGRIMQEQLAILNQTGISAYKNRYSTLLPTLQLPKNTLTKDAMESILAVYG